ncbi:MAG: hypothetical protein M3O50_05295, partial [Myxococcota bacterium]|nr:hypothetical protein [Myxococcota bacterium]
MSNKSTFLDQLLMKLVQHNGTPVPTRSTVNFLGGDVADNPSNDSTDVALGSGGGSSSPWATVLDLDFTAEGAQTFSPAAAYPTGMVDAPYGGVVAPVYSVGGKNWEYHNNRARLATQLVPGAGLVFRPAATATYEGGGLHACPLLQLPLGQLGIPNLDWRTPLRIYVYVSAVTVADHGDQVFASLSFLDSYSIGVIGRAFSGFDSVVLYGKGPIATDPGIQTYHDFGNLNDSSPVVTYPSLATYRVFVFETAPASRELRSFFGDYAARWPDLATEMKIGPSSLYSTANENLGGGAVPPVYMGGDIGANYALSLGMQAATGAAGATIARVRVDYRVTGGGPPGPVGTRGLVGPPG